jgi:hypothetical protein
MTRWADSELFYQGCQACRFSTTCFCLADAEYRAKGVFLFNAFTAPTILCAQARTGGLQILF